MNHFSNTGNKDGLTNFNTHKVSSSEENDIEENDIEENVVTLNELSINGVQINNVNFNDIHKGNEKYEIKDKSKSVNNKKVRKIEYLFYDVESLNCDKETANCVLDLSSIKTEAIFVDNEKKKSKKANAKKKIKLYKKKYKIIPEHNLDIDVNYEDPTMHHGVLSTPKKKRLHRKKKNRKGDIQRRKETQTFNFDNHIFLFVLKMVVLVSSIYSLGAFSTTVTKFVFFVEKLDYAHVIALFQFFIMYLMLKLVIFLFKMESSIELTRKDYIKYIISIATMLGVDTITSNSAYSYLEIPIITVFKSSSLILIYFLSVKFGLRKLQCSLLCSIITILAGTLMSISSLKIDSFFGFFLLIISVVSSSFKWVFTNLLLRETSIKPHVILLHVYRMAVLIIMLPSLLIDASKIVNDYKQNLLTRDQIFTTITLLTLGSLTNIFLILAELMFISLTSSVTLGIVGVGKEAVMLIIGTIFFGEKFGLNAAIGIAISMIGTIFYGYASK